MISRDKTEGSALQILLPILLKKAIPAVKTAIAVFFDGTVGFGGRLPLLGATKVHPSTSGDEIN
ncbi:MAG: hypothetical protein ACXVK3_17270, partial [Candidatus Angelobacter sp.]